MTKREWLLVQFISELAEVQHRATKMLQFGVTERQKEMQDLTNKQRLEQEWTDLMATAELIDDQGCMSLHNSRQEITAKQNKVAKYLAYADSIGIIEEGHA